MDDLYYKIGFDVILVVVFIYWNGKKRKKLYTTCFVIHNNMVNK